MRKESRVPNRDRSWHNGGNIEIGFYARSLHRAARTLTASLDLEPHPKPAWDACPVILLYRQAVELHLKALVDEGARFTKPILCVGGANRRPDHQGGRVGESNSNAKVLPALPISAP